MNNISKLLLEAADLLAEGAVKTSKKHKLDSYLKKYDYQGDKKSGTITVNGRKIEVDRNTKSYTAKGPDGEVMPRMTAADLSGEKDRIILGKDFEKLKNNKRRDALLNHEIAHTKYHNLASDKTTQKTREAVIDGIIKDAALQNPYIDKDAAKKEINDEIKDRSKKPEAYTDKDKRRHSNLDKFKKYENDGEHANRTEFEADAYARSQKHGEHLKRGLRDASKYYKKHAVDYQLKAAKKMLKDDDIYDPEEFKDITNEVNRIRKDITKRQNISTHNDLTQRSKAMKDKSIDRNVYRESIEYLLDEAIELLDL